MKQSTKLLSLVLAIVMAFSCMSVIGSAADTIGNAQAVAYDSIDDALLTPEQVSDIALDLVDGLLADADLGKIEVIGMTLLDLTNVNTTLDTLFSLADGWLFSLASGIVNLGALEDLDFGPLEWESSGNGVQRGNGNFQVILHLVDFIGCETNANVLKKAAYGIESGDSRGIELGILADLLGDLDLSAINNILADLPGFLGDMIYDMLLFGSYRHPLDAEELEAAGESLPYDGSLDGMLNYALLNLLTDPQDKDNDDVEGDGNGWYNNSYLLPTIKAFRDANGDVATEENKNMATVDYIDLRTKSVFDILDVLAQSAINDLGVNALNHNLKKGLMEAIEVEFSKIDYDDVPGSLENDKLNEVKDIFADEASYVTYIGYDCMAKDEETDEWYYTTLETIEEINPATGKPATDEDGNVITTKDRVYFKANTATANSFYDLIEWDYVIYGTDDVADDKTALNTLDYGALMSTYGSLTESLNHIIYIVYENALKTEVKEDFAVVTGDHWLDGATSGTIETTGEKILNYNINRLVKYLLSKFPDKIFGSDSPYADTETYSYDGFYKDMTIIDIAALIAPGFFTDVMPQLIMPVDGDGAYAFASSEADGSSVALLQFGALVLREFMTEIAPSVNYDNIIFAEGTLTSAEGRQFADHDAEEWFNIILNMGLDVGFTYLGNITNFGDSFTFTDDGTSFTLDADGNKITLRDTTLPEAPTAETAITEERWMNMLDKAILWAVGYVGQGSNGIITGINPTAVAAIDGPLNKLSYILNTILPLGFVNGCNTYVKNADGTETGYDLDVEVVFNKLKTLLTTFDLTALTSLFGRNGVDGSTLKKGNILAQPVIPMVLGLVNDILYLVFAKTILPVEDTLDNLVTQDNASTLIYNILTGLNGVKQPLLMSALPVVGKLIKGWGTEQSFAKPSIGYPTVIQLNSAGTLVDGNGNATTQTITVSNGANGIWRSWIDESGTRQYDEQYQIEVTGVSFVDFETNKTISGVSYSNLTTGLINFGQDATFDVSVSGISGSKIVRIDVSYKVYEGTTEMVAGATYTESVYTYLSTVPTDANKESISSDDQQYSKFGSYSAQYFDISQTAEDLKSDIENRSILFFRRHKDDYGLTAGKGDAGALTITATANDDGALTPGTGTTADEFGANTTRNFDPIKIFVNGDYTCTGDKTDKTLTISGASIDTTKLAEKAHGDVSNFTFKRHEQKSETDSCGNTTVNNYDAYTNVTFVYYDGEGLRALESAVSSEIRRGRVEADYLTEGFSYADRVLATETVIDEVTGEETIKETNSELTAWVDSEGEPLADEIAVTPDAENEEIGTYEVDGQEYTAKLVTKIDNSTVWATYEKAVKAAAAAALDGMTINAVVNADYAALLDALNAAATDIGYCKADVEADPTVSNAIDKLNSEDDLKGTLDSVEAATTDKYDYTDYMMWRLNRLNDARKDAQYYIDLKKDADRAYANVDKKFPYSWIEKDDLTALIADTDNAAAIGNNGALITALLEDLTTEEEAAKKAWLDERDAAYAEVTAFDIALAKSLLEKTSTRLRNREYKGANGEADTTYLATEIASAEAMITDSTLYTERSWAKYSKALAEAKAVVNGTSQKDAFDTKWELLCCRNELVLVENEADYSELEELMKQAQFALNNQDKYDNTAKELGQVLAELGFCSYDASTGKFTLLSVENADGNDVDLFPGSAAYVNTEPYAKDEQDEIDDAADALKEALARLKFINLGVAAVEGNGDVDYAGETTIVFDDLETDDVDESVTVKLATIGAGMNEDAVKALFDVTADNATVGADNITVSNDRYYSIEQYEKDEEGNYVLDDEGNKILAPFQGFAGTNSVVTFYTVQDGIKIPVATIKLIVNGDINGDGTVDVIDAAQMHLAANKMATLEGCYLVAGNLAGATDSSRVIDGDDYTQVINAVVA